MVMFVDVHMIASQIGRLSSTHYFFMNRFQATTRVSAPAQAIDDARQEAQGHPVRQDLLVVTPNQLYMRICWCLRPSMLWTMNNLQGYVYGVLSCIFLSHHMRDICTSQKHINKAMRLRLILMLRRKSLLSRAITISTTLYH